MGKTFRRNDFRRPKRDKFGQKSRKQQLYEEEKFKFRPHPTLPQETPEEPTEY